MTSTQNNLDRLIAFKRRDKFSDQAWNDRGLNPSSIEVSLMLSAYFNLCADRLIEAVNNNVSDKQLKTILKSCLVNFNKRDYDTEEKEFICDVFHEMSQIVNINFSNDLNRWLYGLAINTIFKIKAALNPKNVLDTLHETCPSCGEAIDTFIIKKEKGIPDFSWNIVQCNNCKDYLLVSYGPDVKESKFGNYKLIEQLPKEQFTKKQAEVRLDQMRHFRK